MSKNTSPPVFKTLSMIGITKQMKEMPLKDIKEFPLDSKYLPPAAVYRLAAKMQKGKVYPLLLVNQTTGHLIGDKVVLRAMRELLYETAWVVMLKLSWEEEIAIYNAFPN